MATLMVRIKVRPGREQQFESMITDLVDHTLANETEVIRYEYWKGQEPLSYYAFLSFTGKTGFFTHQDADYHRNQPYDACIESMQMEWLDPVEGASPLPRTRNPALPADTPVRLAEWENRSPIQTAAWWESRK
jgi:quinol monooxygenase YgiN